MRHGKQFRVTGWALLLSCPSLLVAQAQPGYVTEPSKRIPIVYDADVVVAGAGISGIMAALAAAKHGAKTVLIERYSSVGGVSGPGLNAGGGNQQPGPRPMVMEDKNGVSVPKDISIYPDIAGMTKLFAQRLIQLKKEKNIASHRLAASHSINYLATIMLQEASVEVLVSTLVTDPIMDGNTVKGVFIENKSGRGAVRAKVVIDATGEADVARRAGATIIQPKDSYQMVDAHSPNGIGLFAYVGGVDWKLYLEAIAKNGKDFEGKFSPRDVEKFAQIAVSKSSENNTVLSQQEGDIGSVKIQVVRVNDYSRHDGGKAEDR